MTKKGYYETTIKRLLGQTTAAAYVGLSVKVFKRECDVKPILMGSNNRILRYDVRDLDSWIEKRKAGFNDNEPIDWLERVGS